MAVVRCRMWQIAGMGSRRFRGDPRYNLDSVTAGFLPCAPEARDDSAVLERICSAYVKAIERQAQVSDPYRATPWWEEVRRQSLGPVRQALQSHDISTLQAMYRNFYRDPCSAGLIAVPFGMANAYFGKAISRIRRSYYLYDVLHRLEYWKAETGGRFPTHALATPDIGNPFGAFIEGVRIEAASPYRHYCAYRISSLLNSETPTVAEIGGGFGGMAFYLLRDRPDVRYFDFDVPESLALTAYYLMTAFPHLNFDLYGESRETTRAGERPNVSLLPLFELSNMAPQSVDLAFSSHAMSDIPRDALPEYLTQIARITRLGFLHIGVSAGPQWISDLMTAHEDRMPLVESRRSIWNTHRPSGLEDMECLYGMRHVDGVAIGHRG